MGKLAATLSREMAGARMGARLVRVGVARWWPRVYSVDMDTHTPDTTTQDMGHAIESHLARLEAWCEHVHHAGMTDVAQSMRIEIDQIRAIGRGDVLR